MKYDSTKYGFKRGQNELHTVAKKCNFWYLVNSFVTDSYGQLMPRYKGPNGEPVYGSYRNNNLIYKDASVPNIIWVRDRSGSIRTRTKNFSIVSVCYFGKWYSVTNKGYQDRGTQRWRMIEIVPVNEDDLKHIIPEIIECEKTKDGNAEAWFE